jgi:hypothetical protein
MKKTLTGFIAAAIVAMGIASASAAPAQIILIRHGEKPAEGNQLNDQGFARAKALVPYFQNNIDVTKYGTPVAIYAMGQKGSTGSVRPIQTVTPLAQALGLTLDTDYLKTDYDGLVNSVLGNKAYDGKMVLICWEHNAIPDIVATFSSTTNTPAAVASTLPTAWDGDAFDRTWILNLSASGQITSFQDLPQHIMPGDSDK